MTLASPTRKALLTVHVLSSVGWVGAVLMYLALGVAAVTGDDTRLVRAVYLAMDWAAWVVVVPLAVTSLLSGIVQSLATPWGLLQHYWVIFKLVITVVATIVLLAYTATLDAFAQVATRDPLTSADLGVLRSPSVIVHSAGALILLLAATVLAVYKPAGLTRHGQRLRQRQRAHLTQSDNDRESPHEPSQHRRRDRRADRRHRHRVFLAGPGGGPPQ